MKAYTFETPYGKEIVFSELADDAWATIKKSVIQRGGALRKISLSTVINIQPGVVVHLSNL